MKANRSAGTSRQSARPGWASVAFIFALAAAVASHAFWRVNAATTLDPTNPALFQTEGTQTFTPGSVLKLKDTSISDFIMFFAFDNDAYAGTDLDLIATFRVTVSVPVNADAGNRIVINDGISKAAIAACILNNGVPGIGLYSSGSRNDPSSYPVFVPADWETAPITIRLRRTAIGDVELIEVNGVAPSPRALLTADKAPANTRAGASVEFGSVSPEAQCTVEYSEFRSEKIAQPATGALDFTQFRVRDTDSADRVRFRADYTLGATSDGINPAAEPVTIKLSTPSGGQIYPAPDFNPLNGFSVQGKAPRRRWTLTDAERARSGIEQLIFDEDPNNSGGFSLRDFRAAIPPGDYSVVNVEITIGTGATADRLTGVASMEEKSAGSGRWRLASRN
ncbi:MAG: hypothetical protein AB7U82_16950 [Blastocatellales bacterium]